MKKRMAIVLSAVMTLAMGTTAMAAPSPSITTETVQQVVVSSSIGGNGQAVSLSGQQTATPVSYTHLDVYKRQVSGRQKAA